MTTPQPPETEQPQQQPQPRPRPKPRQTAGFGLRTFKRKQEMGYTEQQQYYQNLRPNAQQYMRPPEERAQEQLGYVPTYFQDPKEVARAHQVIKATPEGSPLPEYIAAQKDQIIEAYNWFSQQNGGRPDTEWKHLTADDPALGYLSSLLGPPQKEPKLFATAADFAQGAANWEDISPEERKAILADPNFQITDYPLALHQQIIADPDFDWSRLPKWQKHYYTLSSNAPGMGAVQGATLGAMGGPAGIAVGGGLGAVLGYTAYKTGYDPTQEFWNQQNVLAGAFGAMNWAVEQLEKGLGFGAQAVGAATGANDLTARELFTRETWQAGGTFFEAISPSLAQAGQQWSDGELTGNDALKVMPQIWSFSVYMDLILNPEKYKGLEHYLGSADPVELGNTFYERMNEARDRIAKGEDYRQVMIEMQTGIIAQVGDMAGQAIFDPLNVMPQATNKVLGKVAEARGDTVAARSFAETSAPLEAMRRYKTLVQAGDAPAGYVDNMGSLGRFAAGLNEQGQIRAGMFTQRGLLDAPAKPTDMAGRFRENLAALTPEARAREGATMFYNNMGALLSTMDDPAQVTHFLKTLSNSDMKLWRDMGGKIANSPEWYTILPALKAFDTAKLDGLAAAWELAGPKRDGLIKLADVLGEEPGRFIEDLAKRGTAEQDYQRVVQRLQESDSPQAKELLGAVERGEFTVRSLQDIVEAFTGEGALYWHPDQFKAAVLDAMGAHFDEWAVEKLGLANEAKSTFFRTTHLLKSAQSVLLLGGSPGYALQNGLSGMVHRAATGVYGYMTSRQIDAWLDRFGARPARLEEGVGIGGIVEQATTRTSVKTEAITQAVRGQGNDGIGKAQNFVSKIARGMPFNKLSSWFERVEGKNAYMLAMRDMWGKTWRRGTGFREMTPELRTQLQGAGINPGHVYALIEAGMSKAEIERNIFGRQTGLLARSLVNDAAQKQGIPASQAAHILEKLGVLDELDASLTNANTADKVRQAFKHAITKAQDFNDMQTARDLQAMAEDVKNKLGAEGAPAALDVIQRTNSNYFDTWLEHYARFGEMFEDLREIPDMAVRNKAIEMNYQISDAEFRRINARTAANYQAIFDTWGRSQNPHAMQILASLAQQDASMKRAYDFMRQVRREYFDLYSGSEPGDLAAQAAWFDGQARIDTEFALAFEQKGAAERAMGDAMGNLYEEMYGPAAGEAARKWWEDYTKFSADIVKREKKFRSSLAGMNKDAREAAKAKYYGEDKVYQIAELERINQEGIQRLEKVIRNSGQQGQGGTPTAPTPPPTSPLTPGAQELLARVAQEGTATIRAEEVLPIARENGIKYANRMSAEQMIGELRKQTSTTDEINQLLAAAEQRKQADIQAKDARRNMVYEIANSLGRYDPGELQTYYRLVNTLKREDLGGIPDLNGLYDERLTPEFVRDVLSKHEANKAAEAEADAARRALMRNEARELALKTTNKDTSLLRTIRQLGGIDISLKDIRADIGGDVKGWQPGVFSKKGKKRWGIDDMARILAEENQFPIDLNDPADPGGVNQLMELMRRERAGEKIYPTTHDYDAEIVAAENAHYDNLLEEAGLAEEFDAAGWQAGLDQAVRDGDLTALYERIGEMPEEMSGQQAPSGETWNDYVSRIADETAARVEAEARDYSIAEAMVRAEEAQAEMEARGEAAMTRQIFRERLQEAFGLTDEQVNAYMEMSDAVAGWYQRTTGESADQFYSRYYEDIRNEVVNADGEQLYQLQPINRRLNAGEVENYARALSRDEAELRRAIRNEPERADRLAILNAVHKINPELAKTVALGNTDVLFQTAYHGSPYKFDKFTLDKIGTGEGAQAFGWGLYFTDSRAVADWYRETLSGKRGGVPSQVDYAGERLNLSGSMLTMTPKELAVSMFYLNDYSIPEAINGLEYWKKTDAQDYPQTTKKYDEAVAFLQNEFDVKKVKRFEGQTYAVDIPDEGYLLWDRPLSEQSQQVREALKQLGKGETFGKQTGRTLYEYLKIDNGGDDKAASLALKEAGINGIKYLDGSSRGKGTGTYNYVIFDDNAVNILETYYQTVSDTAPKGAVTFDADGIRATIHAFEAGDFSTVIHENAHVYRRMLSDVVSRVGDSRLKADLTTIEEWAGVKDGQWTRDAEEKFARGFEKYVTDGQAPTPKLRRAFENFKRWMLDIYRSITGSAIDVQITPEVRTVFDRMLGQERYGGDVLQEGLQNYIRNRQPGSGLAENNLSIQERYLASLERQGLGDGPQAQQIRRQIEQLRRRVEAEALYQRDFGKPQQKGLFETGEDAPLFSGTPQRAQVETFQPRAEPKQASLFDTAQFVERKKKVQAKVEEIRRKDTAPSLWDYKPENEVVTEAAPARPAETPMPEQLPGTPEPTPSTPKGLQDFGEDLPGLARKDMPRNTFVEMKWTDDDIKARPLSELWPKKDIDAIDDIQLASFSETLRSALPSKPRDSWKLRRWVDQVKTLREFVDTASTQGVDYVLDRMRANYDLRKVADKATLLRDLPRETWGRVKEVNYFPDASRKNQVTGEWETKPWALAEVDGKRINADNLDDLAAKVREALSLGKATPTMKFQVRRKRGGGFFINKEGDPLYRPLMEFDSSDAAFEYIKKNRADLEQAWEGVKEVDNVKETDVRGEVNRPRTAQDWRKGRDVTPDMFLEEFGFKGVEFGNWVSQGANLRERQGMVNAVYDALKDLSDVTGIPPRALSLNGTLGLALGSRGSGRFAAHFEPGNIVINLTKTKGAGTFAHEWFHALDNYFSRQRGSGGNYITYNPEPSMLYKGSDRLRMTKAQLEKARELNPSSNYYKAENWAPDPGHPDGVRVEVEEKFANLVQALDESPMTGRAKLIDKGKSGGYWSKIIERAARTFENYIINKMGQHGFNNDYLANVVPIERFTRSADRYPYLLDSELAPVAEAFDELFKTFQTRETPEGTTMLFQEANKPFGTMDNASGFKADGEWMDEGYRQHVRPLLDAMQDTAIERLDTQRPMDGAFRDMSPEGQRMLQNYIKGVQEDMGAVKLSTMKWGESQRDHALLNYNRRYGFDKYLEVIAPYQFFYTRSLMTWGMRALDKPSWFANYARLRNQQNRYERDIPERLRNKFKIDAPWMPDWMGDALYIDPLANLFTPANFLRPFETMMRDKNYQMIETERILQEWAESGTVSQDEILRAVQTREGTLWERAQAEAEIRREAQIASPFDFMATMFGPAWYLSTPLNLLGVEVPFLSKGDPNKVSSTPLLNTSRAFETVTKGSWAEPIGQLIGLAGKPEQWLRERQGLPEFGEYGDYYVDRQIANMVADGLITSQQAQVAMIERQGDIFEQARERVKMELAMRVPLMGTVYATTHEGLGAGAQAFLPSLFGSGLLPAGELEYRGLKDDWNAAWKKYDGGDKQAVTQFFEDHPEYEAYLAKGKEPQERLRSFMIGNIWDAYMALGETDKKLARQQMGDDFADNFLNKETRNYESVDVATLTRWSQMLGALVPQTEQTAPQIAQPTPALDLYDPQITAITDRFFAERKEKYNDYYFLERGYYNLPKSDRPAYLRKFPRLKEYWDWKARYYDSYPELKPIFNGQAFKTVDTSAWPPALEEYVAMYAMTGKKLPKGAYKSLEQVWIREGMPMGDMQAWLDSQVVPAMLYAPAGQ